MRIEYLTTGLQIGGAEAVVVGLALGMTRRGHEVSVTSLADPQAHAERLAEQGIEVRSLGLVRDRKDWRTLGRAVVDYRRRVAYRAPDILHAHMVHANLFARAAVAFQPALRLICTIHNTFEGGRLRDLAYALSNWASDLDTTISHAATRRYVDDHVLPRRRTLTVYNGITLDEPLPRPVRGTPGPFRWLAVGRLVPQKDYPTLLAALGRLADAHLTIVGDGPLRAALGASVAQLGLTDRVAFLGARTDIAAQFTCHDGYVLASAWEGFGLALAEAMAARLPVVATRSGGPQEIVGESGACGVLVEPGDAVGLAAAMGSIAQAPAAARAAMGQEGRSRIAARFDFEAILDQWEAIYVRVQARR